MNATLENAIKMDNSLRVIVNTERTKLADILKPYVGKKIQKADCEIIKKIKDCIIWDEHVIETLTPDGYAKAQIYLTSTEYSVWLNVSICYNGGSYDDNTHYCTYYKDIYCVADVRDRMLTNICENEPLKPLSAIEQRKQYDKVQDLEKQLESEKDKLCFKLRNKKYL